ncbi:Dak1-domain-containing protein [Atractiella rhizophila]|nr:Dak1-domain-containing protein [Atractiella rhizophila]
MTSHKHFIKDPTKLVVESLQGLTYLDPSLQLEVEQKVLHLPNYDKRVHLISGGGSGHEPSHAAFVSKDGPLSAAVCGEVFASPNSSQVEWAVEDIMGRGGDGVILVVKNYTGDLLHFGIALERFTASHPDKRDRVRMVVVGDDVAVGRKQGGLVGRRGLTGTCLVYKIASAAAIKGFTLDQTQFVAEVISQRCVTYGVSLGHCHVPGTGHSGSGLTDEEMEIGMGIHNEPGNRKTKISTTDKVVDELLRALTTSAADDVDKGFSNFKKDGTDEVVLLVNNLGGISDLEFGHIVREAGAWLEKSGYKVRRALAGPYMTSLNMPGFSITLLHLPAQPLAIPDGFPSNLTPSESVPTGGFSIDKETILELLDAPTAARGWKVGYQPGSTKDQPQQKAKKVEEAKSTEIGLKIANPELFIKAIKTACEKVIAAEPEITKADTILGDGDAGLTLKGGAEAMLQKVSDESISSTDLIAACLTISDVVETKMGGTSGGLYSIFFNGLAKGLRTAKEEKGATEANQEVWARGLDLALNTLYGYTRARPPSRTLIDPLTAFIITLSSGTTDFSGAVKAATEAADATSTLEAKAGRAAYVEQDTVKESNVPDAGATGVKVILQAIESTILNK